MEVASSIATMDQWHYTDDRIQDELDGEANEQECLEGLEYLAGQVHRADLDSGHLFKNGFKNQQTLKLLDTWGRPPSETHFGNSYWVGSYRGCKSLSGSNSHWSSGEEYRYCWVKIRPKSWPEHDEMVPPTSIRVGVCLPGSCNTRLANQNKSLLLDIMKFNFSPMHRGRFNKIMHVYCLPKAEALNKPTVGGMLFRILAVNWITLLVVLSIFAAYVGKENMSGAFYNLTIQENYRRFAADDEPRPRRIMVEQPLGQTTSAGTKTSTTSGKVDFRPLGVARFWTTLAVIFGHCFCARGWISNSSSFHIAGSRDFSFSWSISFFKSTDIFWLLNGILTSYTILRRIKSREKILKPTVYIGILLARYLRLAAIQVVILSFIKAIYIQLGEGPYWDYGTYKYSLMGQCQQSSWWRVLLLPILFAAPGDNYKHECLPVTWHIVADLKLSLIAPLLVYLLASKSHAKRWLLMFVLAIISLVAQYNDLTQQQVIYFEQLFTYSLPQAINMLSISFEESGYYNVMTRLFPLSVGMLAGVYLNDYKEGASAWPRWMKGWFFLSLIGYQVYDFFLPSINQYRYVNYGLLPGNEATLKWATLLKPRVDSIMFALMVVRLATDLAPAMMSHAKSFYKLGKLSYCVLLVHPMVISYLVNADESSRMDTFFSELLRLTASCVCLSYLISFPLYILFECPLNSLTGSLFVSRRRRHHQPQNNTNENEKQD